MEKFELVNKDGEKTEKIISIKDLDDKSNIPENYYLPVVGVVILNNNNEVMLQKRSIFKKSNPGKWGICGGKVDFGETTIEAGIRETYEEIGIKFNKEDFTEISRTTAGKGHYTVYCIRNNVDINKCKIQEEEVECLKYFSIKEIENIENEGFEWLDGLKNFITNKI